jgi:hypothetical protein
MGIAENMRARMRRTSRVVLAFLVPFLGGTFLLVHLGRADELVPPSRQVVIVMRALAYDTNLKSRAGDAINVAILHKRGHAASEAMANTMNKAFGALTSTQVSGLPIVVSQIAYNGAEALRKSISGAGIDLLYVCEGLESELGTIKEVTQKVRVLSVGSKQAMVEKGLSLGVFEIDGKCTILLNLTSNKSEGVAFGADLLRLAKVIR